MIPESATCDSGNGGTILRVSKLGIVGHVNKDARTLILLLFVGCSFDSVHRPRLFPQVILQGRGLVVVIFQLNTEAASNRFWHSIQPQAA